LYIKIFFVKNTPSVFFLSRRCFAILRFKIKQ
jgi:hypothetical protein